MPRRTKILATLGPDSSDTESIRRLIVAGVNVFRLNFSHGSAEEHSQRAHTIRNISKSLKTPVGILCDMQGPKIRIGSFSEDKKISLKEGDKFTLDSQCHPEQGNEKSVSLINKPPQSPVAVGEPLPNHK
jgi:pyruvate kinase